MLARTSYAQSVNADPADIVFPGGAMGSWTISMWVRGVAEVSPFFTVDTDGETNPRFLIERTATTFRASLFNDAGANPRVNHAATPGAEWNWLAVTSDGSLLRLYYNGAEVGNIGYSGTFAARSRIIVGDVGTASPDFDMAQLAIWDRTLAAGELADLHTAGRAHDLREATGTYGGATDGPQHWYPADALFKGFVIDRGLAGSSPLELVGLATRGRDEEVA